MFHQQQSNSSNYQLPSWSKRPRDGDEWCLEEIKNGVVVQKHKLDLPVITFGRTPLHLPTNSSKSTCTSDGSDDSSRAFKSVLTAHESCSRLHARIAFDSTGTPWLRDLGSGNGTTINKKKLPPQSIGRQESTTTVTTTVTTTTALQVPSKTREKEGSRGVILFPGDVVQFGASTRIYVVQGPSYFDRGAVKARKQQRQQQQQQQQQQILEEQRNEERKKQETNASSEGGGGISWGMNFDASNDNEDDDGDDDDNEPLSTTSPFNLDSITSIPEKHRKLYDQIKSKKFKLENIETEMKRIHAKSASMELTSGQQAQLDKNEKRREKLEQEVIVLEKELQTKLNGGNGAKVKVSSRGKKRREDAYDSNDDDVDDFYDRTKRSSSSKQSGITNYLTTTASSQNKTKNGARGKSCDGDDDDDDDDDVETIETLTKKWKSLVAKLQSQADREKNAQDVVEEIQQEIKEKKRLSASNEDCFFLQNDLDIASDEWRKLKDATKEMEENLRSTERLILIIDEKLVFDRELVFIGYKSDLDSIIQQRKKKDDAITAENSSMMMPPPPPQPRKRQPQAHPNNNGNDLSNIKNSVLMPPPPPVTMSASKVRQANSRISGPTMPPPALPPQEKDGNLMSPPKPQQPTAATSPTSTSTSPTKKRKRVGPVRPPIVGTLQVLQQQQQEQQQQQQQVSGHHRYGEESDNKRNNKTKEAFNPKVDQWVAPKGQDGSGKTKLNAKFAGRY